MTDMHTLQHLLALEQIKQLKARYFRCMDTKDWPGLEGVFAPEAELDMRAEMRDGSGKDGLIRGAAAIAAFIRSAVEELVTVHHGHTPEIELLGPDSARGIWAMEDKLRWPAGAALESMHGYGHYHETYQRIDAQWYIKTSTLSRLRVDLTYPPKEPVS